MPDGAGLDPIAEILADHGAYREGIGPQWIQGETKLRGDLQRQLEVVQVVIGQILETGAWRCGYPPLDSSRTLP